jgi:hypothetical protein
VRFRGATRDLVAEYVQAQAAADTRLSQTAVAAQIGVPRTSLDAALRGARAEGDPRLAGIREPRRKQQLEDLNVGDSATVRRLTADDLHRARVTTACHAYNAEDLRDLLDELGLGGDFA